MISTVFLALGLAATGVSAACTRESLKTVTDGYLATLKAGTPASFTAAAAAVPYSENAVTMEMSKGVLSQGVEVEFSRSIFDTTECASYTEIVTTIKHAYVIGTRIVVDPATNMVTSIESILCDDGDWLFNAAGSLRYNKQENWDPIPAEKRDTREVIKAAGEAYVNAWSDSKINPPFASPCSRLEGGAYLTGNCKLTFPPPFNVTKRSYTIDEELGAIDIFHNFPFLDKALPREPGTQTNNLMRVEAGKIRYIHENTVCTKKGCNK